MRHLNKVKKKQVKPLLNNLKMGSLNLVEREKIES